MPYTLIWAVDGTMPGIEIKEKSLNYTLRLIIIVQTGLRSTDKKLMKKIVFLDIDGVLNTERWYTQMNKSTPKDRFGYAFDPVAVDNLYKIIAGSDADIVVSSSWKCFGLNGIQEMWKERNLPGNVIGVTPNTISDEMLLNMNLDELDEVAIRGREIEEWLSLHGKNVDNFVILDDIDSFLTSQKTHLVLTNPIVGITEEDATKALSILNM